MQWYYAVGADRKGPVSETELQTLIGAGAVKPDTLVWHAQLDGWKTAASLGLFGQVQSAANSSELTTSSASSFAAPDGVNAMRDGNDIVVPIKGAMLPARCVKTNEPVDAQTVKTKALYWCTPVVLLSALLSLLVTIILYLVLRKKVDVPVPLSASGRGRVTRHVVGFLGVIVLGFCLLIFGAGANDPGLSILLGFGVMLVGLIYGAIKGNALRVTKIDKQHAWLRGACPDFLASLPPFQSERR